MEDADGKKVMEKDGEEKERERHMQRWKGVKERKEKRERARKKVIDPRKRDRRRENSRGVFILFRKTASQGDFYAEFFFFCTS